MCTKMGYAFLYGVIVAITVGFFSWVVTGEVNRLFQFITFLGAFIISLLGPPKNPE